MATFIICIVFHLLKHLKIGPNFAQYNAISKLHSELASSCPLSD